MNYQNKIAKILLYIGIAEMIGGVILGFYFGMQDVVGYYITTQELNGGIFLIFTLSGFVGGMLLIGFAELIERQSETNRLLRKMVNGGREEVASTSAPESNEPDQKGLIDTKGQIDWDIEKEDTTRIHNYFSKKNMVVNDIIATPFNYKFVVIANGKEHLIRIDRGYSNQVLPLKFSTYPQVREWMDSFEEGK
ncbi:hypothetical protein BTR22_05300 [Alkalihalophilus pseudofirmus]|uniref:hypothetical protein n=1 Tax=Alkalihalophilus pseudofirmus TaxID=79885 RepID=UPI000950FEDB|nr:hypothetical protein BTR22_05300 [Alkalihalophilus pseudofirmus]